MFFSLVWQWPLVLLLGGSYYMFITWTKVWNAASSSRRCASLCHKNCVQSWAWWCTSLNPSSQKTKVDEILWVQTQPELHIFLNISVLKKYSIQRHEAKERWHVYALVESRSQTTRDDYAPPNSKWLSDKGSENELYSLITIWTCWSVTQKI